MKGGRMILVEFDGRTHSGEAFQFGDDILVRVKGMRPKGIPKWQQLFDPVPEDTAPGGHLEVGEWDGKSFELDKDISFGVDPYGQVIAFVGILDDLPLVK
jgi:hypothetical protein